MPIFVDNYLGYLLAKCSHVVSASFHAELKKKGVPVNTWRILMSVNDQPRTVGELVDLVLVSQPTLSKALDRLERDQMIVRKRDENHKRRVYIEITEKAKGIVEELTQMANKDELKRFEHISKKDEAALKKLLHQVIDSHEKPSVE